MMGWLAFGTSVSLHDDLEGSLEDFLWLVYPRMNVDSGSASGKLCRTIERECELSIASSCLLDVLDVNWQFDHWLDRAGTTLGL
jgi:hypothetical protein